MWISNARLDMLNKVYLLVYYCFLGVYRRRVLISEDLVNADKWFDSLRFYNCKQSRSHLLHETFISRGRRVLGGVVKSRKSRKIEKHTSSSRMLHTLPLSFLYGS